MPTASGDTFCMLSRLKGTTSKVASIDRLKACPSPLFFTLRSSSHEANFTKLAKIRFPNRRNYVCKQADASWKSSRFQMEGLVGPPIPQRRERSPINS